MHDALGCVYMHASSCQARSVLTLSLHSTCNNTNALRRKEARRQALKKKAEGTKSSGESFEGALSLASDPVCSDLLFSALQDLLVLIKAAEASMALLDRLAKLATFHLSQVRTSGRTTRHRRARRCRPHSSRASSGMGGETRAIDFERAPGRPLCTQWGCDGVACFPCCVAALAEARRRLSAR